VMVIHRAPVWGEAEAPPLVGYSFGT
jgi:hypothetical protein